MPALYTPLVPISIASIYNNGLLPHRMALCTPDTKKAVEAIAADLHSLGFGLRLSDMFRSYDMQKQAHADYVEGRKKAFSPAPGGSMHEAGRAMDIDLSSIGVPLSKFWEIAKAHGFDPIIDRPDTSLSESWHFDCRGSHGAVYDYVSSGKAGISIPPYAQMSHSSISAIGVPVDAVPSQDVAYIQSSLIRLGFDPGRIDGVAGDRTRGALEDAGVSLDSPFDALANLLRTKFSDEYPET
jgi:hypothetical protein